MLPSGGDRCLVAQPLRLDPGQRPLGALATQGERWPWLGTLELLAYARSERTPVRGPRAVVELVRFAPLPRARIEAELARLLERPIAWAPGADAAPGTCEGEPTCASLSARFLDPQTVQLSAGEWEQGVGDEGESHCAAALREHPRALEISARTALLAGTELRDSQARLELERDGLERITLKRYAEPEAAERALRQARRGHDELPVLAGVSATSLGERHGDVVAERLFASFAELELALQDRRREAVALRATHVPTPLSRVDAHDADAVCSAYDAQLDPLRAPLDVAALARVDSLLERARALTPDHDGLARRHYQLRLAFRNDPRGALTIAEEALAHAVGDATRWQLQKRVALSRFDEAALRSELLRAYTLAPGVATRMAHELAQKVGRGEDYERAEWAFMLARELAGSALKLRRAAAARRVPVLELVRLFTYLGQSERPQDDLGVHVLLRGSVRSESLPRQPPATDTAPWLGETLGAGRPGLVLAATSRDDAELRALGRALAQRLDDGPFELLLGLEAFATGRRATLAFVGRREGAELWLEQVSRPLQTLAWGPLDRLLLQPLRGLVGAAYPPDELSLSALDADEQSQLARAAESAAGVQCGRDGTTLRCHGALSDPSAARRALLAVAHERLVPEARALWSGSE
ncbi:MAG: hypothetical protein JWN48_4880 [Myxococcaceae bacterium]|nr:hypothetical protein [Myxococcaceae bacterium]